jgi:RNA polymerase-binding protein DksA
VPAKRRLNLDDFRQRLEAERKRLTAQLEALEERTQRKHDAEALAEEQDFDDAPGDAATETLERGQEMALEENIQDLLLRVEAAFEKIDRGTYGVCDACGCSIKMIRLKALPSATLCVECQGRMERA